MTNKPKSQSAPAIDVGTLAAVNYNRAMAEELLGRAHLLTPEPMDQITALMTAATVAIEKRFGRALAPNILIELMQPTLVDWCLRPEGEAVQ